MRYDFFNMLKPKKYTIYLLLLSGSLMWAQGDPSTVGRASIGDSIFVTEGNGGIDVRHYDLSIMWDDKTGYIKSDAKINIRTTQKLSAFSLDFHGLEVTSVRTDGTATKFSREKDKLFITLPKLLGVNASFVVDIHYEGKPDEIKNSVTSGWHTVPEGARALSEPNSAKNWFPCNNHPRDKASYGFHITVPKGYDAVANGTPQNTVHTDMTSTYNFVTRAPMASYLTLVSIGHYDREVLQTKDGIPIYNYYYKKIDPKNKKVFALQADIMAFYSEKFGAYPFDSAGIVASQGESILAYETQTRSFFGATASEQMLAHEIAHQWFGDLVSLDEWKENWIKEGFATYASVLWLAHKNGKGVLDSWVKNTYESLMGIEKLPKTGLGKIFRAFEYKERLLSKKEVTQLIKLGAGDTPNASELAKALSLIPKEGISNYKLDTVFGAMSFPYFSLTFHQYNIFMDIISGTPQLKELTFEKIIETLASAPRDVHGLDKMYSSGVYMRGALSMHALRMKIGDDKFFTLLKRYFKKYKDSYAASDDFEALAQEVTGEKLKPFFKAWLEDKLIPNMPQYGLFKKDYKK